MGFTLGSTGHCSSHMECELMILGIETSVEQVGVALGDYRGVRAHSMLASDRRHAESLTPMIQFVMQQAEVEMSDLSAVAVDVGPGLFTGMRVGIAAAQSIAWALELPMIPVCSLDVVAMNAHWSESVVAASLDARRGEVYWALYRMRAIGAEPQRITEPVVSSPEDLAVHLADRGEEIVCVGSGFDRHQEVFQALQWAQFLGASGSYPSATHLVTLAGQRLAADDTVLPGAVEPMYLRAPDAEINWQTRGAAS
ncbi:MAG: tRNA (adenosine(37)-N6)-threonylcarbamoyltransferase complex dimerization subunit type 1 TsaB [Actinobacteria bacterium]|nr:tRNA (adenosine(37)-N6)-threonylcarbamoyltransferase complex dimerization subunit type 1 TsaB [Actinomycetota bacterium]